MGASLSTETLFWLPLGTDLMLLGTTYTLCKLNGVEWFLNTAKQHSSDESKKSDVDYSKDIEDKAHPIHDIWDLAMIAYSAYGCLLPWAAFVCYNDPSLRTSCSWAMTTLMFHKLMSEGAWKWQDNESRSKVLSILFYYLPTYGGYAVYSTFFKE